MLFSGFWFLFTHSFWYLFILLPSIKNSCFKFKLYRSLIIILQRMIIFLFHLFLYKNHRNILSLRRIFFLKLEKNIFFNIFSYQVGTLRCTVLCLILSELITMCLESKVLYCLFHQLCKCAFILGS